MKKFNLTILIFIACARFCFSQNTFNPSGAATEGTANAGINVTGNGTTWVGADYYVIRSGSSNYMQRGPNITFADPQGTSVIQSYQGSLQFFTGSALQSMNVLANGNVGVGNTNPNSVFQVGNNSTSFSTGSAGVANLNNGTSYVGFNASRNPSNTYQWLCSSNGTQNGGGIIFGDITGNINFVAIANANVPGAYAQYNDATIKSMISFQITPTGVTHAKQILVSLTGWPDYVFKPAYHLLSLTSLKSYIAQNHHLPDMPSAEQVAKDGLNLGEMNKLLTKKVEELTLYLIDKDKQLKVETQKNQEQEERIKKLEDQMQLILNKSK